MPAFLHLFVCDADAIYAQAIAAGAQSIEAPSDMPYGDRRATVSDAWGNLWQIAVFHGAKGRSGLGLAQRATPSAEAMLGRAVGDLRREKTAAEEYAVILATVGA